MRRSARLSRNTPDLELEASPAPAPVKAPASKKPKRLPLKDRPRPEYPYELIHKMPVTQHIPDASELTTPLDFATSKSLGYSVHASRNAYLNGAMFDTVWSRKPRAKGDPEPNPLNRTMRLCDCVFIMGPHRFLGKLYTVREDDVSAPVRHRQVEGPPPSSQQLVLRLRGMAQTDTVLKNLMAEVATGKASPQLVAEFQKYMQKAKEMDAPKPPPEAPKETSTLANQDSKPAEGAPTQGQTETNEVPASTPAPKPTPPSPPEKPMFLAFEFNDNPSERFVFPRDSIHELLANMDVLLSFIAVNDGEYTPLTITIRELPPRFFPTFEKCFEPEALARKNMTETMHVNKRSKSHYVWYQIDKSDALVLDEIRKLQPPYFAVQQPKRQYKTRKYTQKYPPIPSASTPSALPTSSSTPSLGSSNSTTSASVPTPAPQMARPKLNLPDVNSIRIPAGGLPPLPKSLQGLVPPKRDTK